MAAVGGMVLDDEGELSPQQMGYGAEESAKIEAYYQAHPEERPKRAQSFKLLDFKQLVAVVGTIAIQFVPGIGQTVGYAVLGAGDVIAGAALAGQIAAASGVSSITAASVVAATGAATIAAGVTAAQGGDAADIIRAAAVAGSATITNFAAGGGRIGAGAGSAVGTAIAGGNLEDVAINVVAAATGAAVSEQLGPGAGAIATDLVKTGGVSDRTLINAALAEARVEGTPQSGASKIERLYDRLTAPPVKEGSEPVTIGNATYQELQDGSAKVTRGSNVTIMSPDNFADVKEQYLQDMVSTPVTDPATTIPPVEVTAGGEGDLFPTVTDADVINQIVAEQPAANLSTITVSANTTPSVANVSPVVTDFGNVAVTGGTTSNIANISTTLDTVVIPESVTRDASNVSPVVTDISSVDQVDTTQPTRELDRVVVTGSTTPDTSNVAPVVTDLPPETVADTTGDTTGTVAPVTPEIKEEKPKDEIKTPPSSLYPTITGFSRPARGRQPIITGQSPARLLADALAAYRPAGAIEGEESGKERQNVWNQKSLRLKDALGL